MYTDKLYHPVSCMLISDIKNWKKWIAIFMVPLKFSVPDYQAEKAKFYRNFLRFLTSLRKHDKMLYRDNGMFSQEEKFL